MTGSVRGALSNERPYRDRARSGLQRLCRMSCARSRTDTVRSNVIARYRNASAAWEVQSCTGLGLGSGCRQPSCQPGDG
jgi:hypothetical protein